MMAAGRNGHEYQDSYKRYGIDMKPKTVKKENIKSNNSNTGINAKDKFRLLLLTAFIGRALHQFDPDHRLRGKRQVSYQYHDQGKYGASGRDRKSKR